MLLNKHNLNITQFAAKADSRYSLRGIQVTPAETVATNGHVLVRVSTPNVSESNYPCVAGFEPHPDEFKNFILPSDVAKDVLKAIPNDKIPILNHARVSSNGSVQIATTNLDNPRVFSPKPLEGAFPDWQRCIPSGEPIVSVSINADYLADLAKAAGKIADARSRRICLRIYENNGFKNVSLTSQDSQTGQTFTSVLMPMRD